MIYGPDFLKNDDIWCDYRRVCVLRVRPHKATYRNIVDRTFFEGREIYGKQKEYHESWIFDIFKKVEISI